MQPAITLTYKSLIRVAHDFIHQLNFKRAVNIACMSITSIILVGRYLINRTINFIFRVVARREESFFVQDALVPNANQAKCFILSLRKHF